MASDEGARPIGFSALVEEKDAEPGEPIKKPATGEEDQVEELQLLERSGGTGPSLSEDAKVL